MDSAPIDPVKRQYEAYPYPARDPADEGERLIEGSPSHPVEIDHFLFAGQRDWAAPMRILVAGGGTGDALIMLAQLLADRGTPAEIHYLDLSTASRDIAEARAAARGLTGIAFHTGDLLTAPSLGPFDYIDCCGVLHHLPDPQAGFNALAAALAPDGGMGGMVYAPYGRAGVYEMQAALSALVGDQPPAEQLRLAKPLLGALAPTNGLARNPFVQDHRDSDAGLYDLLLHSRDTPYDAPALISALERAGLSLAGWCEPARYDPASYLPKGPLRDRAAGLPPAEQWALAERLAGNIKAHVFYAAPMGRGVTAARSEDPSLIPVLHKVTPGALAATIAKRGALRFTVDGLVLERRVDRGLARLVGLIDGARSVGEIRARLGIDHERFAKAFQTVAAMLGGFNLLRFSGFRR